MDDVFSAMRLLRSVGATHKDAVGAIYKALGITFDDLRKLSDSDRLFIVGVLNNIKGDIAISDEKTILTSRP